MSQYTSPTPADGFLDPGDPILFPRLTAAQIAQLAENAETLSLSPGEVVFEQGQRDTPLYVVLSGAIDVIDRQPDGDRYFTQCQPGTFAADISMFTGEPTIAEGVTAEETSVLAVPPDALRSLVAGSTELGDLLLRTMVVRREWLRGQGLGNERLIGTRSSGEAFAIRELLHRNLVPFSWHDIDTDDESKALLDRLGIRADECPVLVRTHNVLRRPTVTQVADELGLRAKVDQQTFDAVVLGAGPAGLASAVYASSEGITTLVIERFAPGGQAGTSARIENYLGFPTGLSGSELTQRATLQASGEDVIVVGGGNSAGQAVVNLASYARRIHLVVRRSLTATMSRYLIDRIEAAQNVVIREACELKALHGGNELDAVTIIDRAGSERRLEATAVFAMIGAAPRTEDLGLVGLDDKGFIVTGEDARRHRDFARHRNGDDRRPLLLETTRPNVFAVGDVRSGSTKRVASAVGDGALVVRSMHEASKRFD